MKVVGVARIKKNLKAPHKNFHCLEVSCKVDHIMDASVYKHKSMGDISTCNWPTNSELFLNNSLLELYYFDSNNQTCRQSIFLFKK